MVDLSIGVAALTAVLGYAVVFLGIVLLMLVIFATGAAQKNKSAAAAAAAASPAQSDDVIFANEKELFAQFGEVNFAKDINKDHVVAALAAISEMERRA